MKAFFCFISLLSFDASVIALFGGDLGVGKKEQTQFCIKDDPQHTLSSVEN